MPTFSIFDVAGSGMRAQSMRLNVTASNLANAENVAGRAEDAYRVRHPVFQALMPRDTEGTSVGVQMRGVIEGAAEPIRRHQPEHPEADDDGFVYASNVNPIQEMVDMLSAARSFENNIEILNTSKELMLRTLRLGQ